MRRPLVSGLTAATSTTAIGVAINVATEHQGSVVAWLAVGALTVVMGGVPALIDRARPSHDDTDGDVLIEIEIDVQRIVVRGDRRTAKDLVPHLIPVLQDSAARQAEAHALPPPCVTLPDPLSVALVTRGRTTAIARRHHRLGDQCMQMPELDVRLCSDDDAARRREALLAASVVVLDDHCRNGTSVGGLTLAGLRGLDGVGIRGPVMILGCEDGASSGHTSALRHSIDRPVAFLACAGSVPTRHAEILYPEVLTRLAELAGGQTTADDLRKTLDGVLTHVRTDHPQLRWDRWSTTVLHPIDQSGI